MMGRKPDDVGSLFMSVHVNRVAWSSAARSVEYDIPIVAPSYLRALIPRLLNDLVVSLEHKNTLLGQKGGFTGPSRLSLLPKSPIVRRNVVCVSPEKRGYLPGNRHSRRRSHAGLRCVQR